MALLKGVEPRMASTRCWKCQDRPASRPGGMCHTCWAEAGKPDKEAAAALRAAATNPSPEPLSPPLSTESAGTLSAMRHVVANPATADTTFQQKSMREWREASPASFYGRLSDLEKAEMATRPPADQAATGQPVPYDGTGPCPTCHREPDPYEGMTNPQIEALLGERLEFGRRVRRHKGVVAFLDERSLL
jgi:hypothetical protein